MNTASAYITVSGIEVDVVYKDIKNLHIGVYPPLGRVRVAAPNRLDDEQVRLAVVSRLPWIRRHRTQLQAAERQSVREMVTGESHYVWGSRLRLKVVERPGRSHVEIDGRHLMLYVPESMTTDQRRNVLDRWYRDQLRQAVPELVEKWERRMRVTVPKWSIRRMKTKWGSCNRETGHIWFNVELAKKSPECLEYVVVHEMIHLLERTHGERFSKLMSKFMPNWQVRRDLLNESPLSQETWKVESCVR